MDVKHGKSLIEKLRKKNTAETAGVLAVNGILVVVSIVLFSSSRCSTGSEVESSESPELENFFGNISSIDAESLDGSPPLNEFLPPLPDTGSSNGDDLSSSYGSSYGSYIPNGNSNSNELSGSSVGSDSPSYSNTFGSSSLDGSGSQYKPNPPITPASTSPPTTTSTLSSETDNRKPPSSLFKPFHSAETTKIPEDIWQNKTVSCGVPVINPTLRIIGGKTAVKHSWPWTVHLMRDAGVYIQVCGATLVSARHAISALHCITDGRKYAVMLGKHDNTFSRGYPVKVLKIRKHPFGNVEGDYLYYDLILLTLARELAFGTKIQPACLPSKDISLKSGTMCWASGWGRTKGTGGYGKLKQVTLEIGSERECQDTYGSPIAKEWAFCAGKERGQDTCQGDSGGPLTCKENGKWVLYGATSYGVSCGSGDMAVYAAVSFSMNWLCCFLDELPQCQGIVCDPLNFKYPNLQ